MSNVPRIMVYAQEPVKRLRYACTHLLGRLLGLDVIFCSSEEEYTSWEGPAFQYGGEPLGIGLYFPASAIMWQRGVEEQAPEVVEHRGGKALYPVASGPLPFDIFAAAFYLLSRYEEYLPYKADDLGRFSPESSIMARMGELDKPLIERWAHELADLLETKFNGLVCKRPGYQFIPGYDIDIAYAYLGRPGWRTAGGGIKSLLKGNFREVQERWQVLASGSRDPYDVYDELITLHQQYNLHPHWFFLCGKRGPRDHNLSPDNKRLGELIRRLGEAGEVGIHPSFASNTIPGRLEWELRKLEEYSPGPVTHSRQHYLMLRLPDTYRTLLKAGILHDHSMGFADKPGFRAGTSRPFPFYDLQKDEETRLMIHPFAVMDGTLKEYINLGPDEGLDVIRELINNVRNAGGVFSTLWHNSSLSERHGWEGWKQVYLTLLAEAVEGQE